MKVTHFSRTSSSIPVIFFLLTLMLVAGVFSSRAVAEELVSEEQATDEVIVNTSQDESTLPDEIETDVVQLDFSEAPTEAAPADGPVPSSLKILGKGVTTRQSDTSMAVACVGGNSTGESDCNWLRTVEFTSGHEPVWLGPAFHMGNPKKFHAVLKRVYKKKYKIKIFKVSVDVKVKKAKQNGKRHSNWFGYATFGLVPAFLVADAAVPAVAAMSAAAIMGTFCIPIGLFMIEGIGMKFHTDLLADLVNVITYPIRGIGHKALSLSMSRNPYGASSMTAQNGWNWIESPKRISPKHYNRLREVLSQFPGETP